MARDDAGLNVGDVSLACARALVDELVRGGVRHACLSPGSRSTPIALALARDPMLTLHVHLDERSSAFFALGIAKARHEPVAVACTSGTAAAELFPAVVEASQARVPLILLTADRPPGLRGTAANQTIDQVELYGRHARAYLEPPMPTGARDEALWREAGRAALRAARAGEGSAPGPVQLDCPLDEPLTPTDAVRPAARATERGPANAREAWGEPPDPDALLEMLGPRTVMVAGPMSEPAEGVVTLAAILGIPLIADAVSNARRPGSERDRELGSDPGALASGPLLLGHDTWLRDRMPDVVIQVGGPPTSRSGQSLTREVGTLVAIDEGPLMPAPERPDARWIRYPPGLLGEMLGPARESIGGPGPWQRTWRNAGAATLTTVDALLDSWDEPSEMRVARDLAAAIPDGGTLFVGNSMPVRDLDAYMAPRDGLRVLANRGASGIDGLVSTALGVAASGNGPTVALLGDLSFVHDAGAVLWNASRGPDLVLAVNDNGGGQIFASLGQQELPEDELERLFLTPHGADLGRLCEAAGAGHTLVERAADLVAAVDSATSGGGLQVVRVAIDAERDRRRRKEIHIAVSRALKEIP